MICNVQKTLNAGSEFLLQASFPLPVISSFIALPGKVLLEDPSW